jgi:hypothetical protein
MTTDRIKEIQDKTFFPDSVSVCQALLQVWNECEQDKKDKKYTKEDMIKFAFDFYYEMSSRMEVPFNLISENRLHSEQYYKETFKKD